MKTVYFILSFVLAQASPTESLKASPTTFTGSVSTEGFKIEILDLSRDVTENLKSYEDRITDITSQFTASIIPVLEMVKTDVKKCVSGVEIDFERLFKAKVRFNELTDKAKSLEYSLLQGDRVEQLYMECKGLIEDIDKSGSKSCSRSNDLADVCLYFDVEKLKQKADAFYKTSYEYRYGDHGKPTVTDPALIRAYREYGLKLWKAANSYSVSQLTSYYPRTETWAAIYYLEQILDEQKAGSKSKEKDLAGDIRK